MNGDRERAAAAFNDALALDPTLARAHNGLGVIAAAAEGLSVRARTLAASG